MGIALWAVVCDWELLMTSGGWFAVLGQLMAVIATIVLMTVMVLLGIALVLLPFIAYAAVVSGGRNPNLAITALPRYLRVAAGRRAAQLGRHLYAVANATWKTCWWTVHFLHGTISRGWNAD